MTSPEQRPEPKTELTMLEAMKSLTRLERLAIKKHFGVNIITDMESRLDECLDALVYTMMKRADPNLHPTVVDTLTLDEAQNYFTPDDAVIDESDEGKD